MGKELRLHWPWLLDIEKRVKRLKTELRSRGRSARERLSRAEAGEKSRRIARRLFSLPGYRAAGSIFCYLDAGREVETGEIIRTALEEGKTVAVPLVEEGGRTLRAVPIKDLRRDLAPGFRGIREPVDRAGAIEPRSIDLAIIPGTAFDRAGRRLGRGGGCYDRFLPRLRPSVPRIGLSYECQVVEEITPEAHDVPMTAVVTEEGVIEPGRGQERHPG